MSDHTRRALYLDHAATTPVRPEVIEAMTACLEENFGNPSSRHAWGQRARRSLEEARERTAVALGASPSTIFFVRGGTEGDNLAILGRSRADRSKGTDPHIVVTAVEHPAVLEAGLQVEREGGRLSVVGLTEEGLAMDELTRALDQSPSLVSCMWVNNEVGLRLPVEAVVEAARASGTPVHSDAVQAVGKVRVRVDEVPLDLMTVTGHKIYGPKGTGVLFARTPDSLAPLHVGGGQEGALRPGTEDVAGAIGFAVALEMAASEQPAEESRLLALRQAIESGVQTAVPDVRINAGHLERAPHIVSLGLEGIDADLLLGALDTAGLAVSGGAACASGSHKASPTMVALYGEADPRASVRISLGRLVTSADADRIIEDLSGAISQTRQLLAS